MSLNKSNIEDVFNKTFEGYRVTPELKVIRNIRFKLWKADFLSLNLRKFNLLYASLLTTGVISVGVLFQDKNTISSDVHAEFTDLSNAPNTIMEENSTVVVSELPAKESGEDNNSTPELDRVMAIAKYEISETMGCAPLNVIFKNQSIAAKSYKWDFGDGNYSTQKNPEYTYDTPGKYIATLTIKDKAKQTHTFTSEITVLELPQATFKIDKSKSDMAKREIAILDKSKGAEKYTWTLGDNNTSSISGSFKHTYTEYKPYRIKLIVQSENGCSDTASIINRFIEKDYRLKFPLTFNPNARSILSDGYYEKAENAEFVFYPLNNGVSDYELNIFAPGDILVFETRSIKIGWNGSIRGRIAPAGKYKYKAKGIYPNGVTFNLVGYVDVKPDNYHSEY